VPSVSDLNGLGRCFPCGFGISTGAIATDHGYAGVFGQPFFHAVDSPVREKIDNSVAFKITEDRSISLSLAPCPIIDA